MRGYAFYLTGTAHPAGDAEARRALRDQFMRERELRDAPAGFGDQELFVLGIERCLYTVTRGHGDPDPRHVTWRAT